MKRGAGVPTPGVFAKSAEDDEGKRVGARSCSWKSGRVRKRLRRKGDEVARDEWRVKNYMPSRRGGGAGGGEHAPC